MADRPRSGFSAGWRPLKGLLLALALSGCVVNLSGGLAVAPPGLAGTSTSRDSETTGATQLTGASPLANVTPLSNVTPLAGTVQGVVTDEAGKPAAGVAVTAYVALANVIPLTSVEPLANVTPYRRIQAAGQALSDEKGVFTLRPTATGSLNVEAVAAANRKAWKASISFSDSLGVWAGTLALAPTGTITGKVTAPKAPAVKNFQGVDVYIPGSSYVAKADASGSYTLSAVAAGTFNLAAEKAGLGRAFASGVEVRPDASTVAPDLPLSLTAPSIASILPRNAGPGARLEISGDYFAASTGEAFHVTFNGIEATEVERADDRTLRVTVPRTATTGDVLVRVGDVSSNPVPFQVVKSVTLLPPAGELLLGRALRLVATVLDTTGAEVADPALVWSIGGATLSLSPAAGGRDATGLEPGDSTVSASSGTASSSAAIHHFRVEAVVVDPAIASLNARPPEGDAETGFVTQKQLTATVKASDGNTRAVAWSSSDPDIAAVEAGLVKSTRSGREGRCEITARSVDDPSQSATASVTVTIVGNLSVRID